MKVPRSRISQVVANRLLHDEENAVMGQELAAYLLSENRVSELNSIMRDVQADWAEAGTIEVIAASAHHLSEEVVADIKAQISELNANAKRIIVTEVIDPELLGGLRLNLADRQLDLSVRAQLNKFKRLTMNGKD